MQRAALPICLVLWALAIFLALFVDVPVLNFSLLLVLSVMAVLPYVGLRRLRSVIAGATLLAVVLTPAALLVEAHAPFPFALEGRIVPAWLLSAILVTIVPTIIGLSLLLLWQYGAQLQERLRELQKSRSRIVQVQEGVRRDIAAYLHGRVQARLLVLRARLQESLQQAESMPAPVRAGLAEVMDGLARIAEEDLSGLSRRLYPSILRRGLVPALESLVDRFDATLPLALAVDERLAQLERGDGRPIPEPVRLAAYRIAEEALANVVKHTHAARVVLRLDLAGDDGLRLRVEDESEGFDVEAAAGGLGLEAMHDYAEAAGGTCVVRSAPGRGTQVVATLPWPLSAGSPTPAGRSESP